MNELNVFIGWDSREVEAYEACVASMRTNTDPNIKLIIHPIKVQDLIDRSLYWRHKNFRNENASTEFSFTRFLTPYLSGYKGWSLFCDCDMIFTRGLTELFNRARTECSIMCVKHDYVPKDTIKMNGQTQTAYPKKNWSSFMFFNNSHHHARNLNPTSVSNQSGAWLHQMGWTDEDSICELDTEWNWLVGEYDKPDFLPANIHYTLGSPFMKGYEDCDFAEEYYKYAE